MAQKTNWIREKCSKIVEENKIVELVSRIANDDHEKTVDRLRASEMLLDRAYGKPQQGIEIGGPDGTEFSAISSRSLETFIEILSRRSPPEVKK